MASTLALMVAILVAGAMPTRPSDFVVLVCLGVALCCLRVANLRPLIAAMLGYSLSAVHLANALDQRVPSDWQGHETLLRGQIVSLVARQGDLVSFVFVTPTTRAQRSLRLRLNWTTPGPVSAGHECELLVRFSQPRKSGNQLSFDYPVWLLAQGIQGTGKVIPGPLSRCGTSGNDDIATELSRWRERARTHIDQLDLQQGALLTGLIVGDGSGISDEQWALLRRSGTIHLIVVSGMHLSLIFVLVGVVFGGVLRVIPGLNLVLAQRLGVRACAITVALPITWFYGAFSGYGVATQRALLMLSLATIITLSCRRLGLSHSILATGAGVLLWEPLAWTQIGFWLSWLSTAALLFSAERGGDAFATWLRVQWWILLLTTPLLLFQFGSAPMLSPLTNVVAVPFVGLLVVPLALIGMLTIDLQPLGPILLLMADRILGWVWCWLLWMDNWSSFAIWQPGPRGLILMVAALLCLLPRGSGAGLLLSSLLLAALMPPATTLEEGEFEVQIFDVGQGSAALVSTVHHSLLVDTGPGTSRYSMASDQLPVLTELRGRGIRRLDRLILSHEDWDHSGGADVIRRYLHVEELNSPAPFADYDDPPGTTWSPCRAGDRWRLDGVDFEFIAPLADGLRDPLTSKKANGNKVAKKASKNANERSCVLYIRNRQHSALLPGDIGSATEQRLLPRLRAVGPVSLLLSPHHGSAHSSSLEFVAVTRPNHVVHSAGVNNPFGHPKPVVLRRYAVVGAYNWSTARHGALIWRSAKNQVEPLRCNHWQWAWLDSSACSENALMPDG